MIALGIRLALAGGREALARLVLVTSAVAVGSGLLLATIAGTNAVQAQNDRYAWLVTGFEGTDAPPVAVSGPLQPGQAWWRLSADYFQGDLMGRVDVAADGPGSPVPPGIPALPGPGEFYASPALSRLLAARPAAELADRYPGRQIGVIAPDALPGSDMLVIVIGRTVQDLSEQQPDAVVVDRISTTVPTQCSGSSCTLGTGLDASGMTLVLSVVAAALLFPVLVFIGTATRLSAARREQRFSAMRLIGATPRQIAALATIESALGALVGALAGVALFQLSRPALAAIPFTEYNFLVSDFSLTNRQLLLVVVAVPLLAAAAARLSLRRVSISPLGVTRRAPSAPPRAWRVIPLAAGIGELAWVAYLSAIGGPDGSSSGTQALAYLAGILTTMAGLVVAGPLLTKLGSTAIVRWARRPSTLIAGRRLADNPKAAFRSISGLILAVFISTSAMTIMNTIAGDRTGPGSLGSSTLTTTPDTQSGAASLRLDGAALAPIGSIAGVAGATIVHEAPGTGPYSRDGLATCAQLDRTPALGKCTDGATVAQVTLDFGGGVIDTTVPMAQRTWPASTMTPTELDGLPVILVAVSTDGSTASIETARTLLASVVPSAFPPTTLTEDDDRNYAMFTGYQRLADVVLLAGLPIAGCSLALGIAGGLADRRRPFTLLRLTGTPLGVLRRVVLLEACIPLLAGAAAAAAAGLLSAHLFIHAQMGGGIEPPDPAYYLLIATGLLVSLAIIGSTMPALNRATAPALARND